MFPIGFRLDNKFFIYSSINNPFYHLVKNIRLVVNQYIRHFVRHTSATVSTQPLILEFSIELHLYILIYSIIPLSLN